MNAEITYPNARKYTRRRLITMTVFKWLFIVAAISCGIVNLYAGGEAWSVVVIICLYWAWKQFINPDIAGYNLIFQFVKGAFYLCTLLLAVMLVFKQDLVFWFNYVFPFVIWGILITLTVILFSGFRKQQHNVIPFVIFNIYCLIGALIVLAVGIAEWPVIVLICLSVALLITAMATMSFNLLKAFKKYFSLK